jgi:hypothetical protein
MPLATDFLNSNYFRAEDLDPNVRIETTIVDVRPREFNDGTKLVVYTDHQGKGVVLNQGRLATMIAAYGVAYTGWPGKQIIIRQGSTLYQGKPTTAIVIEPLVPTRIAAQPLPGRITVESGRRGPAELLSEINPPPIDTIDDDIRF